ncbi:hypothetical protein [Priestia megaterium]|uniref:Uncharacterized protein n=1 Tax=Priestia megaterium TaxID=1404 RepID=A0A6M6DZP0_PRIMG|nr:hypothetical protein [Priestia megaterium]QJX80363.1 hypothetical protein FDZ14_30210 [Priestia megaterium]
MNTDKLSNELDKKVEPIITKTEKKNRNRKALKKGLLIVLSVVAAIFGFLIGLELINFFF